MSFVELNSLSVIHFKKSDFHQAYSVWKSFGEHINTIISTQTFENVKLLTRSERGRVTRSQIRASLGIEKEDFRSIINQKFKMYVTYIDSVIGHLQQRFEPWPEWLVLCEHSFNFLNDIKDSTEKLRLRNCLICHMGLIHLLLMKNCV